MCRINGAEVGYCLGRLGHGISHRERANKVTPRRLGKRETEGQMSVRPAQLYYSEPELIKNLWTLYCYFSFSFLIVVICTSQKSHQQTRLSNYVLLMFAQVYLSFVRTCPHLVYSKPGYNWLNLLHFMAKTLTLALLLAYRGCGSPLHSCQNRLCLVLLSLEI